MTSELVEFLEGRNVGFEVRITILGHIQRGGGPSAADRLLATRMGVKAVEFLRDGKTGVMVGLQGQEMVAVPIEEVTTGTRPANLEYYELADILSR